MRFLPIVAALVALLLPVQGTAAWLCSCAQPPDTVVLGVWATRISLLLNAVVVWRLWSFASRQQRIAAGSAQASGTRSDDEAVRRSGTRVADFAIIGGLLLAALGLRLHDIGNGLWYDEIQTLVHYARRPLGPLLSTFDSQNQHLLYSLLAHISIGTFGESAASLRLPAALMGVASVWAVWWFGVRFSRGREALLAAALLTFSYHHVWFSQDARGYTGLLLWTLLATGLFLRLIRERSPEGAVGLPIAYGAAMALGLYTHMTAAFVLAAHGLIWAGMRFRRLGKSAKPPRWFPLAGLLLALTFTLQLYAPVLPQLLQTLLAPTMPGSSTEWKNPAWFVLETLRGLGRGVPGGMFAVLGGIGIALAGFGSYVRQERALAAAMILPGLLLGGTLLTLQHNLWPRLFFFSAAFGALFLIRGIFVCAETVAASLRRRPGFGRPIAGTVCALLIIGSAWSARKAWAPKQDYRGARVFVEQRSTAEDVVATIDMTDLPYRGYLGLSWPSVATPEDLNELRRGHRRVWIVYTFPTRLSAVHPRIWRRIQTDFTPIATFGGTVNGGEVIVGRSKDTEKGVGEPVAYFR